MAKKATPSYTPGPGEPAQHAVNANALNQALARVAVHEKHYLEAKQMAADDSKAAAKAAAKRSPQAVDIPEYAQLLADPINGPACGRPDTTSYKTATYKCIDLFSVNTTNDGSFFSTFAAGLYQSNYLCENVTYTYPNVNVKAGVNAGMNTSVSTDNAYYRVLTYVVEYMPTMSQNTGTGRMGLLATASSFPAPCDVNIIFDEDGALVGHAIESKVLVVRQIKESEFKAPGTSIQNEAFPFVHVFGKGLPASTEVGQIKVTRVIECVPNSNTIMRSSAKHTPCDPHACCMATSMVSEKAHKASGPGGYASIVKAGLEIAKGWAQANPGYSASAMAKLARYINSV